MATTLPTFTRTIDNAFVTTWYEIREEAIDNILDATPIWATFKAAGCLTPQEGGDLITRTIRHGEESVTDVAEGDMLPVGEVELETMAVWTFRNFAGKVQRNALKDRANAGKFKIKSYVGQKITATRDALEQKLDASTYNTADTSENLKTWQGINDIIPPTASRTTGTYGGIARPSAYAAGPDGVEVPSAGNMWWGGNYLPGTLATVEDDLLSDMKVLYTRVHAQQSAPNLILTTNTLFNIFEEFALDISQIIKGEGTLLANLGFEVLLFKGKPIVWSDRITAATVIMLNTDFVEVVYDPGLWFAMTEWKPIPLELNRIAHILCAGNIISAQPRRHGRLLYT